MGGKRQPGHRQRGAGTVTVSRGEQLHQGVLLKEWQRTPMQLLREYCQAKKRKHAFFPRARAPPGRFRVRCVLPDDKSSAKDLVFCPEQDFADQEEAKHCAALLALQYVEPSRPLERKLPDPYRELWLALATAAKPSTATTPANAPRKNQPPGAKSVAPTKRTATPPAPVAAPVAAEAVSEDTPGMDLWGDGGDDSSHDEEEEEDANGLPSTLTSDRKFASRAEYERAQLERKQARNEKSRARENRERANPYKQVFMSAPCREMIEGVLKNLGVVSSHASEDGRIGDGRGVGRGDEEGKAMDGGDEEVRARREAFEARVTKQLRSIGFTAKHVQSALQVGRHHSGQDLEDDELVTLLLDWLCLNVPEGELPKGFNPEGTQLDVVLAPSASASAPADASSSQTLPPLAMALVQRLMKLGYDRRDAVVFVEEYVKANTGWLDVTSGTLSDRVVMGVLGTAMPHLLRYVMTPEAEGASSSSVASVTVPSDDEVAQMREDEMFALDAIYEDTVLMREVVVDGAVPGKRLLFSLSCDAELELFFTENSKYPFEFPLLGVTSKGGKHAPTQCLAACVSALRSCQNALGEPMIYDLCVAVESALGGSTKADVSKKDRIMLLPHLSTVSKPIVSPGTQRSQLPEKKKGTDGKERSGRNSARSKANGQNYTQSRSNKPVNTRRDAEQAKRISERLLSLRRAKDGNRAYAQMMQARNKLPAATEKENVLQFLVHNQVLLVCGQTGCGKTTQVPQFILDQYIDSGRGGECQIICTQPRRIAAIGVATRVAQERCEEIADVVGYQIRMDAKKSANTRLLFCTTGVLLRRLLSDRSLSGISHVIVDEVHERNVDTDFLLSILRDLLPQRPDLRLILMSATMNAELFVNYFSTSSKPPCPVLDIPGFTYPVECHFLDEIVGITSYQVPTKLLLDKKKAKIPTPEGDTSTGGTGKPARVSEMTPAEIMQRYDDSRIDYDVAVHVVRHLVMSSTGKTHGAILVFLPGTAEIKRLMEMINQHRDLGTRTWVLPLHGSLSGSDQSLVFQLPPTGKTKVILSTNIAETSITINDITAVIDTGKVKEMVYDSQLRRSQLLDCWTSRAAGDQRKGRAGRVQAGTCYRLFPRKRWQQMAAQLAAEIHRVSLEQLCLQIKKLELGAIRTFLSKAIEPPQQTAIDAAMQELIAIAAFQRVSPEEAKVKGTTKGNQRKQQRHATDEEVRLTPLGNHLAMLPLDARIGKFLIYGSILRCIEPVATIAACISSKNPFVMSMNDPELKSRQDSFKKELHGGAKSDHLLLARLVERYSPLRGQKNKRTFCREYGLSFDTLETIVELKAQYLQQLDTIGFYEHRKREEMNLNAASPRIVKAALCAGLYANVIQVVYPEQKYFQSAHGAFTEDHDAKKIRYFVQSTAAAAAVESTPRPTRERVFLHPSSCNFVQTQYDSPWLLYTELVQTSKVFVRESTMVNPYALLLFGGTLEVVHEKNWLVLDDYIRFQAVARIGVLIKAIRRQLDALLVEKIANPELDIAQSELVTAISHLLTSEGMWRMN